MRFAIGLWASARTSTRCARQARDSTRNLPQNSPRSRQRLVNHAARSRAHYRALTSLFKPITTAPWHGHGNRAATARRERVSRRQMEVGRIAAGSSRAGLRGSTPSLCPCVSKPPMPRPTSAGASSICTASAWCCAVRCAACAWRSTCRSTAFRGVAIRLCGETDASLRARSRSCSNTPIRLCRCRCSPRPRPTTSSPNGSPGAACSDCRFWSPKATANCASRSRGSAAVAHRSADLAAPPPKRHRPPPAVARSAPPRRQAAGHAARASRRARDHRAELKLSLVASAPRRAASRRTGSVRRRGRI